MTFVWFSALAPKHKAFVHLAERCIGSVQWAKTCRVVKECLLLWTHEWADLDILLPAALFYRSEKPLDEHLHFVQNILESIEFYSDKKIHQVIQAIQENSEENDTSRSLVPQGDAELLPESPTPFLPPSLPQKYTSNVSLILHDAIILASLENLYTDAAKSMINKKAGLFRMIAAEARKKLLLK